MAELIDFEYDIEMRLVSVLISDDGDIAEFDRVRHGLWIRMDDTFTRWKCSECGAIENHSGHPYCHCGAKMDGGVANAV